MNHPVTLLVWRDAQADPPDGDRLVLTERLEFALYDPDLDPGERWHNTTYLDDDVRPLDPQPRLWCDPRAPGDNLLTARDLRTAAHALSAYGAHGTAARLDAAVSAETGEP